MTMTYADQLKHPLWQRKRLERMHAAGFSCNRCGTTEVTLHVHHRRYMKGRMAWEYEDDLLEVLCETCHEDESEAAEILKRLLAMRVDPCTDLTRIALGLVAGYLNASYDGDHEIVEQARRQAPAYFDVGVAAYELAVRSRAAVATFLASGRAGEPGPVLEDLLERWAQTHRSDKDET